MINGSVGQFLRTHSALAVAALLAAGFMAAPRLAFEPWMLGI